MSLEIKMEDIKILDYNYDAIKYFISVAKHGSLSMASKSLGISQSALSQSMKNLEQSMGVTLFNRNTRGVILTDEGRVLYEHARIGNKYFKEAIIETLRKKSFDGVKDFKISISSSLASMFLTNKIRRIQEILTNTNIEFCEYIYENEVVESLQNGKFDLVILKSGDEFNVKEVALKKICAINYVFVYNPAYFQLPESMTFEELSKYYVIMKERSGRNDNAWIKYSFNKFMECKNDNQCLEMIKNGAGIGIYPREYVKQNQLKIVNIEGYKPTKRTIYACFLESNDIAKKVVNEICKQ